MLPFNLLNLFFMLIFITMSFYTLLNFFFLKKEILILKLNLHKKNILNFKLKQSILGIFLS
nr:ATP synthase F0 subunit 8 [Aptinothrips stylifer]